MKRGTVVIFLVGLSSFLALGDRYVISTLYEILIRVYHTSSPVTKVLARKLRPSGGDEFRKTY